MHLFIQKCLFFDYNSISYLQVCGSDADWNVFSDHDDISVCGSFLCDVGISLEAHPVREICSRQINCSNIPDLGKIGCPEVEKEENSILKICNNILCEKENCEDENECNGCRYGLRCHTWDTYAEPTAICDGVHGCVIAGKSKSEKELCRLAIDRNFPSCASIKYRSFEEFLRPIFNFTRCAAVLFHPTATTGLGFKASGTIFKRTNCSSGLYVKPYCLNYMDQTNCSDPDKVAVRCHIQGYGFSSVSKMMVCGLWRTEERTLREQDGPAVYRDVS